MDFHRQLLTAEMLAPQTGERMRTPVEVRLDPLTGYSSRILPERGLMPRSEFDLAGFARDTRAQCPFCQDRIDSMTPRLIPELDSDGRLVQGEAVLFPNLHAYSSHSCVSVYSPRLHYLPLGDMTERLVRDNLSTQVEYGRAVMAADPQSSWASINANHMLPSGSSLFHPHLQGIVDSQPTTMQRMLAEVPPERFASYLQSERQSGERYLADTGRVEWLVSFAPIAPAELRAFVRGISSSVEADGDLVAELAHGLTRALNAYAQMEFESFNLAVYGAPPATDGYPLNLRLGCRSNLEPLYRSDSTFLERLHWEGAIDVAPETVAEQIRDRLR